MTRTWQTDGNSMNEPVRKGNVYLSSVLTPTAYIVTEVWDENATVMSLRTSNKYNLTIKVLLTKYELIGTPYAAKKEAI